MRKKLLTLLSIPFIMGACAPVNTASPLYMKAQVNFVNQDSHSILVEIQDKNSGRFASMVISRDNPQFTLEVSPGEKVIRTRTFAQDGAVLNETIQTFSVSPQSNEILKIQLEKTQNLAVPTSNHSETLLPSINITGSALNGLNKTLTIQGIGDNFLARIVTFLDGQAYSGPVTVI